MRLSSQGTKFFVQSSAGAPTAAATAASKAAPAEITFAAAPAGIVEGDVVVPQGFTWRSLDGRPFAVGEVSSADPFTVELVGSDTTGELNPATLGTLAEVMFGESCMATLTFTSPAGTLIDVTTLCDIARETMNGLPAVSTWQATGFWDAADPMQKTLRDLYRSGKNVVFKCIFNDGSGFMFMAGVNSFDVRVGVDQAVAYTVGGNISGPITDLPIDTTIVALAPAPDQQPQTLQQ
jgi:hypothetical protein